MTRTYRIAAPAAWAWPVLASPQSWPSLGAGELTVRLLRKQGRRALYRASGRGVEVTFLVVAGAESATLHPVPDDADLADPGPPVLTWTVQELSADECELRWTAHDRIPPPLDAFWTDPACSGVVASWAADIHHARTQPDPLAAASALAAMARAGAPHAEAAGTLGMGTVTALRATGLFRLGLPKALGGADVEPRTIVSAVAELSRADAAAGWCASISANQSAYTAWLDEDVARDMADDDGGPVVAGATAISGRAEPAGDTVLVTGRWRFNSGCLHADWLVAGVSMPADEGRIPVLAFVRPEDATILGTWDVVGLAGTGSHDVVLEQTPVPRRRIAPLFTMPARAGGTLHRLSPYNIQAVFMLGVPLGLARGALDELTRLVGTPDARTAVELARLETDLAAARALALDTVDGYWCELATAAALPPASQARLALVLRHAVDTAKRITATAARLAGPDTPAHATLRRFVRDAFAVGAHLAVSDEIYERNAGRLYAGAAG